MGVSSSMAQEPKHPHQYSIMEWSRDDGLPSNYVADIIQDENDFLWVATNSGLSRFDGVSFSTINRTSHPVLLSNSITSLFEDREGNIWFGTHGGGLYTIRPDTLERITDEMGLPSNYVRSIIQDSSGTIWVGTDGEGIGKVLPDTVLTFSEEAGLNRHVHSLALDENKILWIGTESGIYRLIDGSFQLHQSNNQLLGHNISYLLRNGNEMLAATPSGLVAIINDEVEHLTGFDQTLIVNSVSIDRNNDIWISTLGSGVYKITADSAMKYIHGNLSRSLDALRIFIDREDNIWIGTREAGLLRLRNELITTYSTEDGLPDNKVYSVTEGIPGEIWLGSAEGITQFTRNEVKTFTPGSSVQDRLIFTVQADEEGAVWGGTRNGKLYYLKEGEFQEIDLPVVPGVVVISTYRSSDGTLWAGTNYGLYRVQDDEITRFSINHEELTNNDVRSITEDKNGTIWVGTSFGLNAYSNGEFTHYTSDHNFSNLLIVSLHADSAGDIWAGTYGGLHRLRDGEITAITQGEGLPNDRVYTIIEDDFGYFWLGTPDGIVRIKKSNVNDFLDGKQSALSFDLFGRAEGMKNELVTGSLQPTGLKAQDGTLWFATDVGVATLNPQEVKKNQIPPSVRLLSTRVDRLDSKSFRAVQPLELPRNHNEIEISYAAPSFIKPMDLTFRYMLEGLHTEWIDAGSRRSAYFSRLPPGEYNLRVIAANEHGVWNEEGVTLPIVVHPPFWLTWWFIGLVVIFFLTSGPSIYYRRVTSLKKKQVQQQNFMKRLIDSQESERNRIAGELHDSLGQNLIIIKNRAQMAEQNRIDKEFIATQLDEISNTASLTIQEIRKISHNLRPYNLQRFGLTRSVSRMIKNADESSEITFRENLEDIDTLVAKDHQIHFFRIIQESLNNLLKHSEATIASITLKISNEFVQFTLRDDGKGFNLNDKLWQKGFGIEDIEHRANLIGGNLMIKSMPGQGTSIYLEIPISESTS